MHVLVRINISNPYSGIKAEEHYIYGLHHFNLWMNYYYAGCVQSGCGKVELK